MSKNTLFQANKQGYDALFQANNLLKRHFWERINKNHSTKDANLRKSKRYYRLIFGRHLTLFRRHTDYIPLVSGAKHWRAKRFNSRGLSEVIPSESESSKIEAILPVDIRQTSDIVPTIHRLHSDGIGCEAPESDSDSITGG